MLISIIMAFTMKVLMISYALFVLVATVTAAPALKSELEDLKSLLDMQNIDRNGRWTAYV